MTRRLPPLTALRAFEAAARHMSFARAAEELHVSPAAISQQIKQLETYLGVSLFRRGKVLALSESTQACLPLLSEGFDQLERAVARLQHAPGVGPLVVSCPPTFASRWLIGRLDDFHSRFPDIELRLLATRRLVDFSMEDVDLAVRFGSGPFANLHAERLMPEAIIPVASPKLAQGLRRPDDLRQCNLLHDDSQDWDPAFPEWETVLQSLGVAVARPLQIRHYNDANLVIQAASAGLGVGLVWQSLVQNDLEAGHLVHLFRRRLPTDQGYHLVVPANRLALPKVVAFRQWLLDQGQRQAIDVSRSPSSA